MRILLVGAGGVGDAIVKIAANRNFFEKIVVTDYDLSRAEKSVAWVAANRDSTVAAKFVADKVDASNPANVAELARKHQITHVMNAVEPKFVQSIFEGALDAGANYMDMAMIMDYWSDAGLNHHTEATTMLYGARECARIFVQEGLPQAYARHAAASRTGEPAEVTSGSGNV